MKTNSITKRMYTAPKMRVYKLRSRTMILAGSDGVKSRDPYTPDDDNPFGG